MKREQKYPNTSTFRFYNANPKNKYTGDCVVRAISTALQEPYETVYRELLEMALKTGYAVASTENYDKYLKSKGWVKCKQPKKYNNTKYTGKEFCKHMQNYPMNYPSRMVANIGGHHVVAIVDDKVWDTWDSTNGCIGNYWMDKDYIYFK